jgi:hypothetical protein
MRRPEVHRMQWPALRRALQVLLREADCGSLTGVSLHGIEGGEVRISYTVKDDRRDVDLPGVRLEDDER